MGRRLSSEVGWAILKAVCDGVEIFEYSTRRPSAALRYGIENLKILDAERARRAIHQSLSRLKRQKLLEEIQIERSRAFRLTAVGEALVRQRMQSVPTMLPEGVLTVVCFDIPERQRKARSAFRYFLRSSGFRSMQRSVWISDRDWSDLLQSHIAGHDLSSWAVVFRGTMQGATLAPAPVS